MTSPNLLTEPEPTKVTWQMWPSGEHGVQAVGGTSSAAGGIAEEPHITPLLAVDAYHVVFRTSQGYLGSSQSQPGAPEKAWAVSTYAQYLPTDPGDDWLSEIHPNASALKNPRGPISPKRQPDTSKDKQDEVAPVLMTCVLPVAAQLVSLTSSPFGLTLRLPQSSIMQPDRTPVYQSYASRDYNRGACSTPELAMTVPYVTGKLRALAGTTTTTALGRSRLTWRWRIATTCG
jgi:hypothetical protein